MKNMGKCLHNLNEANKMYIRLFASKFDQFTLNYTKMSRKLN